MKEKRIMLKVNDVSKQYRLGVIGTGTISHDLNRWWHKIRGKDDPFLKIGEINDRSTKGESKYVWALKDINFEVQKGEVVGIIGKNGAGKSTLLKILSRVTGPTTGSIKSAGRIASLLEVGTGFHPELTGKENIFLNGAILGMTRSEIEMKLNEIIEFSGCERYVDTPVKRYSSGMRVRLAFAVAAFLDPEILIVDEVLAVGDAEFQKKAIGKMKDVSSGEGKTVLFVSHNMESIKTLCSRAIILENGKIDFDGNTNEGISKYLELNVDEDHVYPAVIERTNIKKGSEGIIDKASSFIDISRISILNSDYEPMTRFKSSQEIIIKLDYEIKQLTSDLRIVLSIMTKTGESFLTTQLSDGFESTTSNPGNYSTFCTFPQNFFGSNLYILTVEIISPKKEHYKLNGIVKFHVKYINKRYSYGSFEKSYMRPNFEWKINNTELK